MAAAAAVGPYTIVNHPSVLAAEAAVARARLNQSYSEVVAPADGIVTRVEQLQPGAYVNASQTLFWLIRGRPWVEANFKEDQIAHMRVGQPVVIHIDAYPDGDLAGHVASFSPGTGSAFSALPAQNATGNWVKVTQRLPVRIEFDRPPPERAARLGLSAHVRVDVRSGRPQGR
jgi:membrane fusion protein (multidrug efflux system)